MISSLPPYSGPPLPIFLRVEHCTIESPLSHQVLDQGSQYKTTLHYGRAESLCILRKLQIERVLGWGYYPEDYFALPSRLDALEILLDLGDDRRVRWTRRFSKPFALSTSKHISSSKPYIVTHPPLAHSRVQSAAEIALVRARSRRAGPPWKLILFNAALSHRGTPTLTSRSRVQSNGNSFDPAGVYTHLFWCTEIAGWEPRVMMIHLRWCILSTLSFGKDFHTDSYLLLPVIAQSETRNPRALSIDFPSSVVRGFPRPKHRTSYSSISFLINSPVFENFPLSRARKGQDA
ncbi:hypothetical protein EV361DRAFT_21437 [Lentinula raphanica]|nr:hypothetical protein EV361DRAFT_21437 [Lentinula raphanica]